jgi:adenosylcobinamide-GDP ribazoletransferase
MTPPRPLRDFALALGFLTVLPVGREWPAEGAPDAVAYYPWVGALLGLDAWILAWLASLLRLTSSLQWLAVGAAGVAMWAFETRMLHWDGLADTADALWGGFDRQRRLEIMRDSRVGSFGVAAVVLAASVQLASMGAVMQAGAWWVLVCAPVLGRAASSWAAWTLPAARREGLGLTAVGRPSMYAVAVSVAAILGLLVFGHLTAPRVPFFAALGVGLLTAFALPRVLSRPVGGMTGDLFGATVIGVETAVLFVGMLLT